MFSVLGFLQYSRSVVQLEEPVIEWEIEGIRIYQKKRSDEYFIFYNSIAYVAFHEDTQAGPSSTLPAVQSTINIHVKNGHVFRLKYNEDGMEVYEQIQHRGIRGRS
jgi:hypothetical protein